MTRFVTCSACGAVGHQAGADGLCSRAALAERAVREDGLTVAEAAALHGIAPITVYCRLWRAERMAATWSAFDRRARIRATAERRTAARRWISHGVPVTAEHPTLPWPDEPEVPAVDARGSEHEETLDPPYLVEVGWRTARH